MIKNKPSKILRGVAGEYFVAGELSKRGYIASITLKNTKGIDILASNSDASNSVGIQVKTTMYPRKKYPRWILGEKADNYESDTLFYVFVLLKEGKERPDFYIVPSNKVALHTRTTHNAYKDRLRIKGFEPVSKMRKFSDEYKEFLEKWDLLGLELNDTSSFLNEKVGEK